MSMPRYVHAYAGSIVASPATTLFSEFRNNGERMTKVRKNDETEKSIEVASVGGTRDASGNVWNAVNYRQRWSSDNHRSADRQLFFPPCEHRRTRVVRTIRIEVYSKQVEHRRAEYLSCQISRHLSFLFIAICVWFLDRPGSVHVPPRRYKVGR